MRPSWLASARPRDMWSIQNGALVVVITNGYSDLIFKAVLSHDNLDRIEGPNRLQSQLFAITPTWMARLEKIPSIGRSIGKQTVKCRNPRQGLANRSHSWRACARRWPSFLIPGMPRLT